MNRKKIVIIEGTYVRPEHFQHEYQLNDLHQKQRFDLMKMMIVNIVLINQLRLWDKR